MASSLNEAHLVHLLITHIPAFLSFETLAVSSMRQEGRGFPWWTSVRKVGIGWLKVFPTLGVHT